MKRNTIKMVALYKCRACGVTYQRGKPVGPGTAINNASTLSMAESTLKGDRIRLRALHRCGGDTVGLGDFIGYTQNISAYPPENPEE